MTSRTKQPTRSTRRKYQSISFPWEVYRFIEAKAKERCCSVNAVVNSVMQKQVGTSTKPGRKSE